LCATQYDVQDYLLAGCVNYQIENPIFAVGYLIFVFRLTAFACASNFMRWLVPMSQGVFQSLVAKAIYK